MIKKDPIQREVERILKNYKKFEEKGVVRFDLRLYIFNIDIIDKKNSRKLAKEIENYNEKMKEEMENGNEERRILFEGITNSIKKRTGKNNIKEEILGLKTQEYEYLIKKSMKKFHKILQKFF